MKKWLIFRVNEPEMCFRIRIKHSKNDEGIENEIEVSVKEL